MVFRYCLSAFGLLAASDLQAAGGERASELYAAMQNRVFQIRVIDIGSGDKTSIGSGFSIDDKGFLATNHHVVARYIQKPEKYRLEYVDFEGESGAIKLVDTDVVNDLVILECDCKGGPFFVLGEELALQGERIYSMGNPHDLGMTIIEGNFNGYIRTSRYQKILFSGSLNGGMSGGPALDGLGQVIERFLEQARVVSALAFQAFLHALEI